MVNASIDLALAHALRLGRYEVDEHAVAEAMIARLRFARRLVSMLPAGEPADGTSVAAEQDGAGPRRNVA